MGQIEFFADAGKFRAVKKLKVDENTEPMFVARFLASVQDTLVRKTRDYMGGDLPMDKLDEIVGEICGAEKGRKGWKLKGRVSEEKIGQCLAAARGSKATRMINEVVEGKKARELAKAYVLQTTLNVLGFPLAIDAKLFEKFLEEKSLRE
ncbi:MAG: DUF2666 family protein [Candidatus Diapherotrites archaeon]|nr:DUF2666 family protein [Candidatus Diapherotrites archaeon]